LHAGKIALGFKLDRREIATADCKIARDSENKKNEWQYQRKKDRKWRQDHQDRTVTRDHSHYQ
jgi:hypothetical protein